MDFLRRFTNRDVVPLQEVPDDELVIQTEALPLQFIEEHAYALNTSSALWANVHARTISLRSDETRSMIQEGLELYARAFNAEPSENLIQSTTDLATRDLATLCFMTARATTQASIIDSALHHSKNLMFDHLPPAASYLATRKDGPQETYMRAAAYMRIDIKDADKSAGSTLKAFTERFSAAPESIQELANLYENGAGEVNKNFQELREIIRTDWHARRIDQSQLRQLVKNLGEDSESFVHEFINWVAGGENDKKLTAVQNLARFALAASFTEASPEATKAVLYKTRSAWTDFQDIDKLFTEFKKQKLNLVEKSFDRIAGLPSDTNPRSPISFEDVERYKARMGYELGGNRTQRRSRPSTGTKSPVVKVDIDSTNPYDGRFDRTGKPIYFAKSISGSSFRKEEAPMDALESEVRSRVKTHIVKDMLACIHKIHENPISSASRTIGSGSGNIKIDGKLIRLRRFKPTTSQGLGISSEALGWRISYGIVDGSVVIIDILDHDQFERKYK